MSNMGLLLKNSKYLLFTGIWSLVFVITFCGSAEYLLLAKIVYFFFIFSLVNILFYRKTAFIVFNIALFIPTAFAYYFQKNFNIEINRDTIGFLFETNIYESADFITSGLVIYSLAVIGFLVLSTFVYFKVMGNDRPAFKFQLLTLLAVCVVLGAASVPLKKSSYEMYDSLKPKRNYPLLPYNAANNYFKMKKEYVKEAKNIVNVALMDSSMSDSDGKLIVLILGESARWDRFSLNGYGRETNPLLSKRDNLISFHKCLSFAASTNWSIPAILTPMEIKDGRKMKYTSFLDLYSKHGYSTVYYSLNTKYKSNNINTSVLLDKIQNKMFLEAMNVSYEEAKDGYLLELIDKNLKLKDSDMLLVLHTRGSHFDYKNRYDAEFEKFKEADGTVSLSDSYDNSILYTDYFIDSIISKVSDFNSVVLYVSDHGESLGDDGFYMHGKENRREQRHVPLIVWFSDKYKELHKDRVEHFRENENKYVSHDHIFHTMLGLAGIDSELKKSELDLSNADIHETRSKLITDMAVSSNQ